MDTPGSAANPALATPASEIELATLQPGTDEPLIRVGVEIPAGVAVRLKHRTNGKLDIAETLSLIAQLYADAPIESRATVLTEEQFSKIGTVLGFTPQSTDALVGAIEEMARVSFAGVKLRLTKEEIDVIVGRNASGLPAREYAEQIFREMFDAWRYGRI